MTCLELVNDLFTSHQGYFRLGSERWQVPRIYRWPSQREVLSICFCWRLIRASFPVSERKQEIQLALQAIPWWLTRDGQTDCRTPAMPPTRSTLQVFKASSRRTTCRSMTRWSGRSELQQGQARKKNSRLRTTTAKLCLRWQYSKAKRVSRFSLRLSPLWTRRKGRKSNTMTTVWCPKSDARSITYILNCRFTMCLMWRKPTCRRLVRNSTRSWRQLQVWTDLWIRVMTSFPCHG